MVCKHWLAAVKDIPSLTFLQPNLWGNDITDAVQALASFKDAASLKALELFFWATSIGKDVWQALAALEDAPSLTAFIFVCRTLRRGQPAMHEKGQGLTRGARSG